ncbi:MAG TPA: riboflavin synthase [Ferruginibacter sp.]|nr:riboflavin synthase [Ferruginibacter sp.]HRN79519.1 riboflavin synthase [Ferruginibacter sp.]HRO17308.1 riboflavin synthase [Ferruginibacter sp.]HRQ20724.1 riboflavin synthase [Ferruginibacter sp.]
MFTGIIENTARVLRMETRGKNKVLWLESALTSELKVDQSLAHNGICLTIDDLLPTDNAYRITAVEETLLKTNLSEWKPGDSINLERAMQMNGRMDGHIVQGHVDQVATCVRISENNGSTVFTFSLGVGYCPLIIEKGSIAINGISLTLFDVGDHTFSVAIIPYTMEHTNMHQLKTGSLVNIEFDVIGKYIQRIQRT